MTALRDPRVLQLALAGCEIVDVQSRASHREEFERLAAEADATILIAPEFDGILLKAARRVVGLRRPAAVAVAGVHSHRGRQAADVRRAGRGRRAGARRASCCEPDERLPADFTYPAVLKPVDGAGSQDTLLVAGRTTSRRPTPGRGGWNDYVPGLAASVAVLCGPAGRVPLVPCKQRISDDGRMRYLGGELPLAAGLAERAVALAERALAALPATIGYVGVDLVLGRDPIGTEDFVIEVNPRLTTSYVGSAGRGQNESGRGHVLDRGRRNARHVAFSDRPLEFDAGGNVSFLP